MIKIIKNKKVKGHYYGKKYQKKILKKWQNAGITDDYIFNLVMQNRDLCKELIERLLGIEIAKIRKPKNQQVIDVGLESKGVRLDVYVKDSDKVFDIEMQTTVSKSLPKRARYYQSIIDVDMLSKCHNYRELRESYIIFICTDDMFGKKLPVYTFDKTCKECNDLILNDGTHVVFFNASAYLQEENEKIRDILEYIDTGKTKSDFTARLQSVVDDAKSSTKWRHKYMTLEMKYREYKEQGLKKGRHQGMKRGLEKGSHKAKIENARNFMRMGFPIEKVAEGTGLTVDEIRQIKL